MVIAPPQTGQRPPCARVSRGESFTAHLRWPSRWYFALLGKELDGADETLSGLQRLADGVVIDRAIEGGRLASELAGRMRVRVGNKPVTVEHRQPPVHRRIGGEPGLDREDMPGEVAITFGD
jgi:hypothetical protein